MYYHILDYLRWNVFGFVVYASSLTVSFDWSLMVETSSVSILFFGIVCKLKSNEWYECASRKYPLCSRWDRSSKTLRFQRRRIFSLDSTQLKIAVCERATHSTLAATLRSVMFSVRIPGPSPNRCTNDFNWAEKRYINVNDCFLLLQQFYLIVVEFSSSELRYRWYHIRKINRAGAHPSLEIVPFGLQEPTCHCTARWCSRNCLQHLNHFSGWQRNHMCHQTILEPKSYVCYYKVK